MTTNPPDRLDRIERILGVVAEGQAATQRQIDNLASNQLQERDRRLELREDIDLLGQSMRELFERMDERQDRIEQNLERLSERQDRTEQNLDRLGSRVDQLTENIGGLAIQMEQMAQRQEQDRSQAAIDRAEFRATTQQLLEVLTQRFTSNGH